jgi:hypothetical protein
VDTLGSTLAYVVTKLPLQKFYKKIEKEKNLDF